MLDDMKFKEVMQLVDLIRNGFQGQAEISNKSSYEGYKIVRTYSAGVFAGEIKSRNGQEVIMTNARRLWKWSGAASLSQLAMEGVKNPNDCMFPCEVKEVELLQVIEILDCTDEAKKSIKGVKVWAQ
jgi:hypothetical protein